jgi:hypothetical protein
MTDVVVKPSPEMVERLKSLEPRVRYHPIAESKRYDNVSVSPQQFYEDLVTSGENEFVRKSNIFTFGDFLLDPLDRKIATEWESHLPVRVRGTVLNIGENGICVAGGGYIKTLAEVLRDGAEVDHRDYVPQTLFENSDEGINHRSKQWTLQSTEELRARATPEQQQFLFPAVIVYNHKLFPPDKTTLPKSPEDRANVILCAYILDYVRPLQEVQGNSSQ